MPEEELQEIETTGSKKYITATFDKEADAALLGRYSRLCKIGGFGNRDVIEAGVEALAKSDKYKEELKKALEESE